MMGRTTLREIREKLAAARNGKPSAIPATSPVGELEALAKLLEEQRDERAKDTPTIEVPEDRAASRS